jgi:hypothetical protein
VARAYTVVPGARSADGFLEGLRRGHARPGGRSGGYLALTADIARLAAGSYVDAARRVLQSGRGGLTLALLIATLPALPTLPIVTAALCVRELLFGCRLHARLLARSGGGRHAAKPDGARLGAAAGVGR